MDQILSVKRSVLDGIGNAVREKNGETAKIPLPQMAQKIRDITVGSGKFVRGVVTVPSASRNIAVENPFKSDKIVGLVMMRNPDFSIDGNVGQLVAYNYFDGLKPAIPVFACGVHFETRNGGSASKQFVMVSALAPGTYIRFVSRTPAYLFQAGEYDYLIFSEEG